MNPIPTGGNNFTEAVTFEAKGLDDILRKTRELRTATEGLFASQVKLRDQIYSRMGRATPAGVGGAVAGVAPRLYGSASVPGSGLPPTVQASWVARLGQWPAGRPIPLAAGMPASTFGLSTSPTSDAAFRLQYVRDRTAQLTVTAGLSDAYRRMGMDPAPAGSMDARASDPSRMASAVQRMRDLASATRGAATEYGKLALNWLRGPDAPQAQKTGLGLARPPQAHGWRARVGYWWHGDDLDRADARAGEAERLRRMGMRGQLAPHLTTLTNVGLGVGTGMVGMGFAGLQGTVAGNRFGNAVEVAQRELGNAFSPALREATHWVEKFNDWMKHLGPGGQNRVMYAGLGLAGYAGLRALGLQGLIHGPINAVAGGIAQGAMAYGPGALRALGGGSMLMGAGVAGLVAAPVLGAAYGVIRGNMEHAEHEDFRRRIREGHLDENEAKRLPEELRLAYQRAGGEDKFVEKFKKEQKYLEKRYNDGSYGADVNWAVMQFPGTEALGLDLGERKRWEEYEKNQELMNTREKLLKEGKLGIGGEHRNEPIAGGGFESFLDTYRRTEMAFGKLAPALGRKAAANENPLDAPAPGQGEAWEQMVMEPDDGAGRAIGDDERRWLLRNGAAAPVGVIEGRRPAGNKGAAEAVAMMQQAAQLMLQAAQLQQQAAQGDVKIQRNL